MDELRAERDGTELRGEVSGEGVPVVLLHGLTATRRYVVHGSRHLQRSGHRVVAYDARGHGRSGAAARADAYGYGELAGDLGAVLDTAGMDAAVLAGASMGAHTIVRFALEHPERVRGVVLVTPAWEPGGLDPERVERYDRLSEGLREGGVDGFLAAYGEPAVPESFRETVKTVLRQRLSAHANHEALADALRCVPRSSPFDSWEELSRVEVPAVVVASRDEADPEHPYEVGRRWADTLPAGRVVSEEPGKSPLAWQGGQLSHVIADLAAEAGG